MGGREIADHLRKAAADVRPGHCIVEVGAWLGAGTAQLAYGARSATPTPTIHVFDKFKASKTEVVKAANGGLPLKKGQNTQFIVEDHLRNFGVPIEFHRGNIEDIHWQNGPIGLYVDDAAKAPSDFSHILKTFGPSWVPGVTVLFFMDYSYWKLYAETDPARAKRLRVQHDFMSGHRENFSVIDEGPIADTTTAIFRYEKELDFSSLPTIEDAKPGFLSRFFRRSR